MIPEALLNLNPGPARKRLNPWFEYRQFGRFRVSMVFLERDAKDLAATLFSVGWGFQFAGHVFEGKKPSFVDDRRSLLVGVLWCLEKYGVKVVEPSSV